MNLYSQDTGGREAGDPLPQAQGRAREARPYHPPPQATGDDSSDLGALLRTALAHKRAILLCALLFVGLAGTYVFTATPLYTATASLILKSEQQNVMNFESVLPELSSDIQAMNTELMILRSRSLLGDVVQALSLEEDPEFNPWLRPKAAWKESIGYDSLMASLGFEPSPPPTEQDIRNVAIEILGDRIEAAIVPQTFAIEIHVWTQAPEKSASVANKIAEVYIANQLEGKFTAMDDAMLWLGRRVAELEEELETAESEYRSFAATTTAPSTELMMVQTEKLKRLRDDLVGKQRTAQELRDRAARLRDLRVADQFEILSEVARDPRLQELAAGLAEPDADASSLARFDAILQSQIQELQAEADRADRQIASLERAVTSFEEELNNRSSEFIKQQQLEREAEATRLIYEHTLARLKEISIQQGIQQSDARVLDPAKIPEYASHPRTLLTVGAGGVFGVLFGLGLVFMRNTLRTTFQSSEELEAAAGAPVIGIIPHARAGRSGTHLKYIMENPASPMAEGIRNLRTTIHLSNLDAPPQVVMLTSSVPGEGKSTVSGALGQASALSGRRVLLIDGDLRRRAVKEYFGVTDKPGLLSVLSGATSFDEAVWQDEASQLDVLIADEGKVTAGDVFGSHRFEAFLREVRKVYDLILIDTPPILAVSDTRVVAQYADAIVYVVRWNATEERMLRAGLNTLRQVNADVTGVVLNGVKTTGSERYGYYGYSYT